MAAEGDQGIARMQFNATLLAILRALGLVANGAEARHVFDGLGDDVKDPLELLACGKDEFHKMSAKKTATA
jgi:hypothetical protein